MRIDLGLNQNMLQTIVKVNTNNTFSSLPPFQCNLPLDIITMDTFKQWMAIFQMVIDRPVPEVNIKTTRMTVGAAFICINYGNPC